MKKYGKKTVAIIICSVLLLVSVIGIAFGADKGTSISKGEIVAKDVFTAGQSVENDGTVKGDLFAAANSINSSGTVEGDLICAARDIGVTGNVLGDMRSASQTAYIAGNVGKNVNIFAQSVNIKNTSLIGGNAYAFCESIEIDGKVKGYLRINSGNITLNGEIFGDVEINNGVPDEVDESHEEARLTILPGTIIHGKLTYKGLNEADIRDGAKITDFQWVKPQIKAETSPETSPAQHAWNFIRLLLTTLVYFLIALILYKLFPVTFKKQGDFINQKPLSTLGIGLVGMLSIIAAIIAAILLLLMSVVISPSVGLMFIVVAILFYSILFYLSTIPVSLWLGNKILRNTEDVKYRFGAGLAVITISLFILDILSKLSRVGVLFGIIKILIIIACILFGIGSLLYVIRDMIVAAKKGEAIEQENNALE